MKTITDTLYMMWLFLLAVATEKLVDVDWGIYFLLSVIAVEAAGIREGLKNKK